MFFPTEGQVTLTAAEAKIVMAVIHEATKKRVKSFEKATSKEKREKLKEEAWPQAYAVLKGLQRMR